MTKSNSFASLVFIIIFGIGLGLAFLTSNNTVSIASIWIGVISFFLALFVSLMIKIADQWEKAVVLRLANFDRLTNLGYT